MEAYLDNAASTKVYPSVAEIMTKVMMEDYGNPSSLHRKGIQAEQYIRDAREVISKVLKAEGKEIIFTSGGTEANNMALAGAAFANQRTGKHIITTAVEHSSVAKPMRMLEENGFDISYLSVDAYGSISFEELKEMLREDTILVSIVYVNNEIGSVQDIKAISDLIKSSNSKALLHVDAIQAFGKYQVYPKRLGIDLMSVSSHKIHGPKGVGFLYVADKVKIKPMILGGGQQLDMRAGTENVPGVAGLSEAVRLVYEDFTDKIERLYELKRFFIEGIRKIDGAVVNGVHGDNIRETAPHIVSASFEGIRSEVMLHSLEDKQIYVSAGSACASHHPGQNSTLKSIGVKNELLSTTVRFSFSTETTMEELSYALEALNEIVPMLRKFVRK